jgi:hypothetical protein
MTRRSALLVALASLTHGFIVPPPVRVARRAPARTRVSVRPLAPRRRALLPALRAAAGKDDGKLGSVEVPMFKVGDPVIAQDLFGIWYDAEVRRRPLGSDVSSPSSSVF